MKKRLFPLLIALSALAVSGSAAFYSVFGLSKLFAGASTQVIIMAGSLEFAKLVVASLLYQYWDTINKFLRSYLMIACFVLMVITSGGIYGFLSGAYQSTATQSELLDKSLLILNQKQTRFEETKEDLTLEKTQINKSISDLRTSLSNPHQVSWYDKNSETVITSSSGSARRALQSELKTTIADRDNINIKIEAVLDSINKTDMALLDKEISNEAESELGPLKYLAETTGQPMNEVVNWFLLLIIFVFDPLAIALVVAANMAFANITPKRKEEDYFTSRNEHLEKIMELSQMKNGEEIGLIDTDKEMKPPVGLREEDNTTQPSESLKQRVKENQNKLRNPIDPNPTVPVEEQTQEEITLDGGEIEVTVEPTKEQMEELEDERRMDIIGQNGNDGLHYEDEESKPVQPTKKELETLQNHLNRLKQHNDELYYNEDYFGDLDRLTDTTLTLIVDKGEDKKNEKELLNIEKGSELKNLRKTQIMLANTNRCAEDYVTSLKLRHNGNYNKLPHYLITKKGDVVNILKPNKVSDFFGYDKVDKQIVVILLENLGWLRPKKTKVGLCDWLGKTYIGDVFEKKWRGKLLWEPYTVKQLETLGYLLKEICSDFNISTDFIGHNVKVEGVEKFKGIVTRSNYSECFKDISPAFNFDKIKEIL